MPLYKYVCPERTDILENGMIRFTQPKYFNDPCDTKIYSNQILYGDGKELVLSIIESAKVEFLKELEGKDKKAVKRMKEIIEKAIDANKNEMDEPNSKLTRRLQITSDEMINNQLGMLCLATECTNNEMWKEYACDNKGFIIVFNNNHAFFTGGFYQGTQIGYIWKVPYTSRPLIPNHLIDKEGINIIFTKGEKWEKEKEWRMVLPLNRATRIEGEIHLFKFPPEIVTGVIFGLRTEESTIDKIKSLCVEDRYKHVKLYQVRAIEDSYDLEVVDYKE